MAGAKRNSRRKTKVVNTVLMAVCLCLLLSGCWDRREIEEQTSVIALAVDTHEKKGVQATIQVPIPVKIVGGGSGQGGGEGGQEAVQLFTARGEDLTDAFKNLQKQLNQDLSLGQMSLLVISEDFARSDLEDVTDALGRVHDVRRRLWPIVVEGKAAKALESDPKLEQVPAVFMVDMLDNEVRRGRQFDFTLGRFLTKVVDSSEQPLLNRFKVTEKTVNWLGAALFKDRRMVGKLDSDESWVLMQLRRGTRKGYRLDVPCPGSKQEEVTFEPEDVKRNVTFHQDSLAFNINIKLNGSIVEKTCSADLSKKRTIQEVEQALKNEYEKEARDVIRKVQRFGTDVLQLGSEIRAYHPKVWDKLNWEEQFPTANINVTYDVNIFGIGARFK